MRRYNVGYDIKLEIIEIKSKLLFDVPQNKKLRVIIDTDAACEADDPFAIAQALMSPKLMVKGILAEHFAAPGSVQKSYDEVCTILNAMDMTEVPVLLFNLFYNIKVNI